MANLRTAAQEIQKAKKVTGSTWEDSTYRARIEETLKGVATGLEDSLLEKAAKFFQPEWEIRSQKFLKRFMMWSTKAESSAPLTAYSKFGNGQKLAVSALANNLGISFQAALFQVVQLTAMGLCRRAEPFVSVKGEPIFNIEFSNTPYMQFYLGAHGIFDHFSDDEIHSMAAHLFAPEIDASVPQYALALIQEAVNGLHRFEDGLNGDDDATEAVGKVCGQLRDILEAKPNTAHPVRGLARTISQDPAFVSFCLLVLAVQEEGSVVRDQPYWVATLGAMLHDSTKGRTISTLRVSWGAVTPQKMVEIGDLSRPHAREILKAAAAQSPALNDPVMPPPAGFKLDATMLGAATVEQLQATEAALRERIEKIGSTLQSRIIDLESIDLESAVATERVRVVGAIGVSLQTQIDALKDQVAVLMKLAGVGGKREPTMTVHTATPAARAPAQKVTKPKKPRVPKAPKKVAKKTTKKTAKKTKKRR